MNSRTLLIAPFYLLHPDDGRLAIWARQLPHLIARDLTTLGADVIYRPLIEGQGAATRYRVLEAFDPQLLRQVAQSNGAEQIVTAGIGFRPRVQLHVQAFEASSGAIISESMDECAPALLMAVLPGVYRHIAGLTGVPANGVPPFLGAGRSETALFALALDLDNDDLLQASGGQLPFDDPFSARYLPLLEALRLDPGFSEARERLCERCRTSPAEETDIAVTSLERAIDFAEHPHELSLELALLLDSRRRGKEAVAVLTGSLERNPGHVDGRMHLGRLLLLTGHSQKAAPHLEEASRLRPQDWRPAFWLGRLNNEAGQPKKAAQWYQRALDKGMPEGPQRKRAQSALQRAR